MIFIYIFITVIIVFIIPTIITYINRLRWGKRPNLFKNDTILLTGSAGGIGTSLVPKLLQHNPHGLILIDCDGDGLEKQFEMVQKLGSHITSYYYSPTLEKIYDTTQKSYREQSTHASTLPTTVCIFFQADVADQTLFAKLLPIITSHLSPLDKQTVQCPITMLINNAGIIRPISPPSIFSTLSTQELNISSSSTTQQQRKLTQQTTTTSSSSSSSSSSLSTSLSKNQLQNHIDETYELQKLMYDVNTHAPINLAHALLHAHSTPVPISTNSIANPQSIAAHFSSVMHSPPQLHILTVASAASMSYSSQLSAYCGSKAAVVQSLRALRFEHQRLLYDQHNPIKLAPPPSFTQQHAINSKNNNSSTQLSSLSSQSNSHQRDFHHISPSYLSVPDGTHTNKIIALIKSVLYQIFPFFTKPNKTPYTYKDHNLLVTPTPNVHWSTVMPWHIDTLMFNNIHASPLIKLVVPSLSQHDVADHIMTQLINRSIDTIYYGQHSTYSESILPFLLTFTPIFSLVPIWLSDFLVGFAGGWHAMDDWRDPRVKSE